MTRKVHRHLSVFSKKMLLILGLIVGCVAMLSTEFIFGSRSALLSARRRMESESRYIAEQCILYDEVGSEEETKSLIRVADKAQQLQRIFSDEDSGFDEETLLTYMDNLRLTGVVMTDETAGTVQYFMPSDSAPDVWTEILKESVSVKENLRKVFSDRFFSEDGYCYDYSVVGRWDTTGIILCYIRQEASAVQGTELSVRTLLSGYSFAVGGVVAVTNGKTVIGSNDESLIGLSSAEATPVRLAQSAKTTNGILSRVSIGGTSYFTLCGRSKNYCVYLFYPTTEVYTSRTVLLSYSAIVYGIWTGLVLLFGFHIESRRRISEMKSAERYHEELNRLANDAIRANEAKTDFLRRMSHDIRTPVNGIRGMLDMAEYYDGDPQKRKECYDKMREASGYLLELVTDVLDMSKLEQGDVIWKDEKFRVDRVFDEICTMMRQQAREKGVELSDGTDGIRHPFLIGSAVSFKRICLNLIGNALKYNHPGGTVSVTCREVGVHGDSAVFEFVCADTGIGMNPDFMRHMYEPFAQEDRSFKSSYNGTGLGLAIVKKLVDRLGGEITVKSQQGIGTTFTVTMSFRIDYDGKEMPRENAMQTLREDGDSLLRGAKILIAEDNDLNMEIAQFILERSGATVVRAYDGKEAVETFMASKPGEIDLILMDLMMPVMDGILATQVIRASGHPDAKTVPIVAMTANAYSDDVERSLQSGMNGHLAKPLDARQLVDVAAEYYEKRKAGGKSDGGNGML